MLFVLSLSFALQAQNLKRCRTCGGFGHIGNVECKGCNGKGLVPMSASDMARRQKEIDDYAKAAGALMDTHNLTPQEVIAFNDLLKEAMKMVPVYVNCTACGGTGKCKQCGGYMNVSLDGPLCRICGGSGFCPACGGNRQILMGYQENPNKDLYIKRSKEILEQAKKRAKQGLNANGVRNNAGTLMEDEASSGASSGRRSSSSSSKDSTKNAVLGILAIVAAFFGYRYYKNKNS